MSEVPASNQNDVVLMTNAAGQTEIVDIYTPQVSYTMPLDNEFYFYVFYEDGKRRVETGKLLFTP
jgi:hypothetical protein